MKNCPFCGKQVEDNMKVCPFCGKALDAAAQIEVREIPEGGRKVDPERAKKRNRIERIIWIATFFTFLFIIKLKPDMRVYVIVLVALILMPVIFKIIDRVIEG